MGAAEERAFLELIGAGRQFVLTTHIHPDGDALGSEAALAVLLRGRGDHVRIVNPDATPEALAFLDPRQEIEVYDPLVHDELIRSADAVVMLDNSDPQRLDWMAPVIRDAATRKVCIDHHPDPDSFWDLLVVRLDAPCTGVVVYSLMKAAGVSVDQWTASALYAALASDTGRFRFVNTSAEAFRIAAELVDAGASPPAIYAQLSERLSPGRLRLAGDLLAGMDLRCDERLVVLRAPTGLVERRGAEGEDLAEVINQVLTLRTARLAALFRELRPGLTKVSLRSKGELDVNQLARRHGGGGHRNASGIVVEAALEDAVARLLPDLERATRES